MAEEEPSDVCGDVLWKNHEALSKLSLETLVCELAEKKLIDEQEKVLIQEQKDPDEKVKQLLDTVLPKGRETVQKFLDVLSITHHQVYVDIREQIVQHDPTINLANGGEKSLHSGFPPCLLISTILFQGATRLYLSLTHALPIPCHLKKSIQRANQCMQRMKPQVIKRTCIPMKIIPFDQN
jgi:hypothetical protein